MVKFQVMVLGFNVESWIEFCLTSIMTQTYGKFNCIFSDDCSTDRTCQIATNTVFGDSRFAILSNEKRMGKMPSLLKVIEAMNPDDEDVLVWVDGDDWLKHKDVFRRVKQEYDKGTWLTYGQYTRTDTNTWRCQVYPPEVIEKKTFRSYGWRASHLKTFKYFLFKKIKLEDFKDGKDNWLKSAIDMAFMFPMLEMAGDKSAFIPDVLYVYNRDNPLNFDKLSLANQRKQDKIVRAKQIYPSLRR